MSSNINTEEYWNQRFSSQDWEEKNGREQTRNFAAAQISRLRLPKSFSGVLLDFGCALGDALPIYRNYFPSAVLYGLDQSEYAISKCIEHYGDIATFINGDHTDVPSVDVIIASNVFEHLSSDITVAATLLKKTSVLYIIVPYREEILCDEHINRYDANYFASLGRVSTTVFSCKGWSECGPVALWYRVYLKNVIRALLGRPLRRRSKQIMFSIEGGHNVCRTLD